MVELQVAGRLPRPWTGALSIGVTLEAPPDPPFRFQDVSRSIDLNPGSDTVGVSMDLGGGKRAITMTAYAVVEDEQGARRLDGPARQQEGSWIELHGDDVPVGLVFLSATPSLLALGQVTVDVARPPWNPVSTALTAGEPAVAIVAPSSRRSASDLHRAPAGQGRERRPRCRIRNPRTPSTGCLVRSRIWSPRGRRQRQAAGRQRWGDGRSGPRELSRRRCRRRDTAIDAVRPGGFLDVLRRLAIPRRLLLASRLRNSPTCPLVAAASSRSRVIIDVPGVGSNGH